MGTTWLGSGTKTIEKLIVYTKTLTLKKVGTLFNLSDFMWPTTL